MAQRNLSAISQLDGSALPPWRSLAHTHPQSDSHTDSPHVRAALPYEIMKVVYENQPLNSLIGLHVGFLGGKQASRQTLR